MEDKSQENLDNPTVFTIKHSEIPKGITQCKFEDHNWVKLSENEVKCTKCPTALIINPKEMKNYVRNK